MLGIVVCSTSCQIWIDDRQRVNRGGYGGVGGHLEVIQANGAAKDRMVNLCQRSHIAIFQPLHMNCTNEHQELGLCGAVPKRHREMAT